MIFHTIVFMKNASVTVLAYFIHQKQQLFYKCLSKKKLNNWKMYTTSHDYSIYDLVNTNYIFLHVALNRICGNNKELYTKTYRKLFRIGEKKINVLLNMRKSVTELQRPSSFSNLEKKNKNNYL